MKATVGAEVRLMGRADQHYCPARRLGYGWVPRFLRYANAIAQDDFEAVEALLRLTANSFALGVVFSWSDNRGFIATDALMHAWRKALGLEGMALHCTALQTAFLLRQ